LGRRLLLSVGNLDDALTCRRPDGTLSRRSHPVRSSPGVRPLTKSRANEQQEDEPMRWTKPRVEEICVGLEINGYFPPEY
jgi:coenzyme PQQ precursor peptide PqqA